MKRENILYYLFVVLTIIIFLISITLTSAWTNTTFNNSLTTQNLTFSYNLYDQIDSFITTTNEPYGITVSNGYIYVVDGTVIKRYYKNGTYIGNFSLESTNTYPSGISSNSTNIFVPDELDYGVYVYYDNYPLHVGSHYLYFIDLENTVTTGIPDDITGISVQSDHFWISDYTNNQGYKYNLAGVYQSENITLTSGVFGFKYYNNNYYSVNYIFDKILIYNSSKVNTGNITITSDATDLEFDNEYVYVGDSGTKKVYRYSRNNIIRYLSVPENSYIFNAYLNLSGYAVNKLISKKPSSTSGISSASNTYDSDTNTFGFITEAGGISLSWYDFTMNHNGNITYNITFENIINISVYNLTAPFLENCHNGSTDSVISLEVYNYTSGSYNVLKNYNITTAKALYKDTICSNDCKDFVSSSNNLRIAFRKDAAVNEGLCVVRSDIFEVNLSVDSGQPSDISLYINDTNWNYAGIFNITNMTSNLARYINSFLNTCTIVSGYCYVPFIFHSSTIGILEYFSLYVNNIGVDFNSITYNSTTKEYNNESFILNMTYDSSAWSSISGRLIYNNTNYTATQTGTGNNILFSRGITIPSGSGTIYNFSYSIGLTNASGTFYFPTSTYSQTVSSITVGLCTSTLNVTYLNFTVKDSEDITRLVNSTFKINMIVNSYLNYSFQDLNETNWNYQFCISPSYDTYTVDATIEYDATGYTKNFYYLYQASLNNDTENITLYLLNDSSATLTEYQVVDRGQIGLPGRYITVQKYDIGTDTYYTIAMMKTSDSGNDLTYLNWYDTFYKEIVTYNGNVVKITSPHKILETPQIIQVLDDTVFEYDKFGNIVYSLTYNNDTQNFILTYTLPSGEVTDACLRVIKRSIMNDTTICDQCEQSSSATIYCNIAGYGNGTYIATFYAKGSGSYIDLIIELIGTINDLYEQIGNSDGSVYGFLAAGIVFTLFLVSPAMAVIGLIIGMFFGMVMGYQPFYYLEMIGLVVVGGLIAWLVKR